MKLTDEQRARMGLGKEPKIFERGWTNDQIKEAILEKGFTMSAFAKAIGKEPGDVYQSLNKRSPAVDKMIAAFLEVHESEIWPNRYFVNGVSIHKRFMIEQRTDEELAKLNRDIANPPMIKTIVSWVDGADGGPLVKYHENKSPVINVDLSDKPKNKDGTVNDPFYDQPIHDDVSPYANERCTSGKVTLPIGMKLDEK